jgi:hypothetical protein
MVWHANITKHDRYVDPPGDSAIQEAQSSFGRAHGAARLVTVNLLTYAAIAVFAVFALLKKQAMTVRVFHMQQLLQCRRHAVKFVGF